MYLEDKKKILVCLFPWFKDIHSIKCTGQICETIAGKFNINAYVVTYKNDNYPKFLKYCPSVQMIFLNGKLPVRGWRVTWDLLWYILRNAKQIDILYLYHFAEDYTSIPIIGYLYKKINAKGTLYVKFETDLDTLSYSYPIIDKKKTKNIVERFVKNSFAKKFYLALDILGVGDNETFDLSKERYLWELVRNKIKIQYNGYRLYEEPVISDFKNKEKIILLAGRLDSPQKGLDVFLEALKGINLNDWKVILAGEILQDQIKEIHKIQTENPSLKGKIKILGFVEDVTEYSNLLNKCRIVCIPSRFDGMPLIIPDAMARGCIIVSSDLFGIKVIALDNEECGFCFPNGDSKALTKLLEDIIANKYNMEELSNKSRKRAETFFTWNSIVERLQLERFV